VPSFRRWRFEMKLSPFYNNKFSFSDGKTAEVFKSSNLGDHRKQCTIYRKVQTGYYYLNLVLKYKGGGEPEA